MTNIVVGLIGLAIGVALGWLIAQLRTSQRIAEATSAARVATERLEAAEKIATDRDALATQFKALSAQTMACLLYTSPSPRDKRQSRMPSSA